MADIRQVIENGNTFYYMLLNDNVDKTASSGKVYCAPLSVCNTLPFVNAGDKISIKYEENNGLLVISELSLVTA